MEENNLNRIELDGKQIILVGTAHVSKNSAEEVKKIIDQEKPDSVCIELDEQRYKSIKDKDKWRNTDIVKIIKDKKAGFMLTNIILSNYQRKIAEQFNINPGQEMIQGITSAADTGAVTVMADRDIQTTFTRLWRKVSFWGKIKLIASIMYSLIDDEDITEEDLERMKTEDMLSSALSEMSKAFPTLKKYLVDERDQYLAYKIKNAPGEKIVAVLGAAHTPGVRKELFKDQDIKELESIPEKSAFSKIGGWIIPGLIILMILFTFTVDTSMAFNQVINFVLWVGSLAAVGTIVAGGHILSAVTSFLMAPLSAIHPLLATGWFAGITEAHIRKPKVEDFEDLSKDLYSLKGFWKNKVTRTLMVVAFSNLGCTIGIWISGANIVNTFLNTLFK
ncbi:TraB/GumN family protein [Alkalibacter mobilis]|uniref:TraB/GumN family protein n=1 Tax=Alkalibacter mobilis TaxID=2787712 RepID=UPI00189EE55F|nr:TraB/GumN family protein [Alkalibacter mobilis]MBF7096525.1 TraB/GumN family protein [Alkalibacter mobilis]